jgi:hypothetical protein
VHKDSIMTPPRWQPALPATGCPYGTVYVTDLARVQISGREVTLMRLSTGRVVVDVESVPELRERLDTPERTTGSADR